MKKALWLSIGAVSLVAWGASGAFTPPTDDQLNQAAANPVQVSTLVKDASVQQAAQVTVDVIVKVVRMGLAPKKRNATIADVVRNVFKAMPDKVGALAAALGSMVAASPTASISADVLSAIQQAVALAAGVSGSAAAAAFGNAYNLATQTLGGAPGVGNMAPPPPPVANPYQGQDQR